MTLFLQAGQCRFGFVRKDCAEVAGFEVVSTLPYVGDSCRCRPTVGDPKQSLAFMGPVQMADAQQSTTAVHSRRGVVPCDAGCTVCMYRGQPIPRLTKNDRVMQEPVAGRARACFLIACFFAPCGKVLTVLRSSNKRLVQCSCSARHEVIPAVRPTGEEEAQYRAG